MSSTCYLFSPATSVSYDLTHVESNGLPATTPSRGLTLTQAPSSDAELSRSIADVIAQAWGPMSSALSLSITQAQNQSQQAAAVTITYSPHKVKGKTNHSNPSTSRTLVTDGPTVSDGMLSRKSTYPHQVEHTQKWKSARALSDSDIATESSEEVYKLKESLADPDKDEDWGSPKRVR